ncbi:hypothetical protein EV421DRAFT_1733012 [Armillaria borealis]|uniref:Uncharacterized protein n=1 Tax=Armillaria borealis TaxID=47425 RepID=A0AA39MWU2_9AGAR|nr:hypothetical protein EV421DRAFT_1733012 [Armillaria borealis]
MLDPSPQLPAELVNIIILDFWYSEHSSEDRIIFMTACPLLSRIWKDVFGSIISQDIHVPNEGYLLYLSSIIRNNNSLIYRFHLPHSLRTITCDVDLVDTTRDAAQEPYTILSNLPNFIGFRKCFPNLTKVTLEIKYRVRGRCFRFILSQQQIIQTRISIALDQATTQFSVLPVDWEIIAYKPCHPDPDRNWEMFLEDVTRCMAPGALSCFREISFQDMLSQSTYVNGIRRFSGHYNHTEWEGDVRGINRRFVKAAQVQRSFSENNSFFLCTGSLILVEGCGHAFQRCSNGGATTNTLRIFGLNRRIGTLLPWTSKLEEVSESATFMLLPILAGSNGSCQL